MTLNPAASYGRDFIALSDCDELFSDGDGVEVVVQDLFHALLSDDFLGPGGDGRGFDVRNLVGAKAEEVDALGPILSEVGERDDRIQRCTVTLQKIVTNGLADVSIHVAGLTADGQSFTETKKISDLTEQDIQGKTV